jgi:hypothetical protein
MYTSLIRDHPVVAVASVGVVFVVIGVFQQATGGRPYGERPILEQIAREDGALCEKFGFAVETPKFTDCVRAISDARTRHLDLLISHYWL